MKKVLLATLALTSIIQSCSQGKAPVNTGGYEKKIVLGAFNDATSDPTLDLSTLEGVPQSVDLREEMTPAKNQSDRGTCTFFATAALVEGTIKQDLGKEINISEEYLNYKTKSMGYFSQVEGSNINSNISAIKNGGLLLERDWSYQPSWFQPGLPCEGRESTDRSAPATCYSHKSPDAKTLTKIIPATGIKFGSIYKDTNEIIKFLAEYRRPLTIDVDVNFNGWPQTGDVFYNEELRQQCLNNPSSCGGHSVLLTGYDLEKKVFFFKNSWGKEWGNGGYGTMTFKMVDEYVNASLYYAHIPKAEDVSIPEDYDQDKLEITNIDFTPVYNETNNTISIKVKGDLKEIRGRLIYTSSFITEKLRSITDLPADNNTSLLPLSDSETVIVLNPYIKALSFNFITDKDTLSWSNEKPLMLNFHEKTLELDSVQSSINSETKEALLRSTIYVHTDDEAFKTIKRVYQPIAQ